MIANKTSLKRHKTRGKCNPTSMDNVIPKTKELNLATKIKKGESNAAPKPTAKSAEIKSDPMSNDTSNTKEPSVSCSV